MTSLRGLLLVSDPASRSFEPEATLDDGSCAPPGLACDELAASGCCNEQLEILLASPALGCRSQVLELHALLYALHCSVTNFGWRVPAAPLEIYDGVNITHHTDACRQAGAFHACAVSRPPPPSPIHPTPTTI